MKMNLAKIETPAFQEALNELKEIGRSAALKKYRFSRSSKHYLLWQERLYDTKCLLAAAYFHQCGRKLSNSQFSGGAQTSRHVSRLITSIRGIQEAYLFEDRFAELINLAADFDKLPKSKGSLKSFGFSEWVRLNRYKELHTLSLPGVYLVTSSEKKPRELSPKDRGIVYIGETVSQNLFKRLCQLNRSLGGYSAHSGGWRLREKGYRSRNIWISVRSFALPGGMPSKDARVLRGATIRYLERKLLLDFVTEHRANPVGNSK